MPLSQPLQLARNTNQRNHSGWRLSWPCLEFRLCQGLMLKMDQIISSIARNDPWISQMPRLVTTYHRDRELSNVYLRSMGEKAEARCLVTCMRKGGKSARGSRKRLLKTEMQRLPRSSNSIALPRGRCRKAGEQGQGETAHEGQAALQIGRIRPCLMKLFMAKD